MELDPESGRLIDARVDETVVEPNYGGESFQGSHGRSSSATAGSRDGSGNDGAPRGAARAGMPHPVAPSSGCTGLPASKHPSSGCASKFFSPSGAQTQGAQGKALPHPGAHFFGASRPLMPSCPALL